MITELEERIMILIQAAMEVGAKYHECRFSEQIAIDEVLRKSEVTLHQEAIEKLVEWLKSSEL